VSEILYRFYNDSNELLYVGITMHLPERWRKHKRNKPWIDEVTRITLQHFDNRQALELAEREAIENEHPTHNVIYNRNRAERDSGQSVIVDEELRRLSLWQETPQLWDLVIKYMRELQSIDPVPLTNYQAFMEYLSEADRFLDGCRDCRKHDDYTLYPPLIVMRSGECLFTCERGHRWQTYFRAAEHVALPKVIT